MGFLVCCAKALRVYSPMPLVAPTNTATMPAGRIVAILAFESLTVGRETIFVVVRRNGYVSHLAF